MPWPLFPPEMVYWMFSTFFSVLKLCLFPGADGVFNSGCTLGCIYAIDFLLLETSHLDCVENAECAAMTECGEHLAKVMMSSARRPCALARLSNNVYARVCVYSVGPESLPPTSQCSCVLFGYQVSFSGGLGPVVFVCL